PSNGVAGGPSLVRVMGPLSGMPIFGPGGLRDSASSPAGARDSGGRNVLSAEQRSTVVADAVGAAPRETARTRERGRLRLLLEREALIVVSLASFALAFTLRLVGQVNQDAWLALAAGREIGSRGATGHESWTIWAHGVRLI